MRKITSTDEVVEPPNPLPPPPELDDEFSDEFPEDIDEVATPPVKPFDFVPPNNEEIAAMEQTAQTPAMPVVPPGQEVQATFRTVYRTPEATPSRPAVSRDTVSGVEPAYRNCAKYIQELVDTPSSEGFKLHLTRNRPASHKNFMLVQNEVIEQFNPMPIADLRETIIELHGGGEYTIRVVTPSQAVVHQMRLRIDEMQEEPKVPINARPVSTRSLSVPRTYGNPAFSTVPDGPAYAHMSGDDDLSSIRTEEQKIVAKARVVKAEAELDRTVRTIKKEAEREREAEETKGMLPQLEAQRLAENQKRDFEISQERMRNEFKDSLREAIDGMKDLVREVASKGNGSSDQTLAVIMKSMETSAAASAKSSEQTMAVLTALISNMGKNDKGGDVVEAIKMASEANKSVVEMAINGAARTSANSEKLLFSVLQGKLTQPENQLKTALDMMNTGRAQAMEMIQLAQNFAGGGGGDGGDDVINHDSGFWGNVGNVVLHGMKRAVSSLASGGGSGLASVLQGLATPGAPPAQYLPQPNYFEAPPPSPPQQPQHQLPPPQTSIPYDGPTPAQQVQNFQPAAPQLEQPAYEPEVMPSATVAPAGQSGFNVNIFEGVIDDQPVAPQPPMQAAPAQVHAIMPDEQTEDLREHVTEAMRLALDDFKAGRKAHDWVEYAIDKWHRELKIMIARAADNGQRLEIIGRYCDDDIFTQVRAQVSRGTADVVYFNHALNALISDVTQAA